VGLYPRAGPVGNMAGQASHATHQRGNRTHVGGILPPPFGTAWPFQNVYGNCVAQPPSAEWILQIPPVHRRFPTPEAGVPHVLQAFHTRSQGWTLLCARLGGLIAPGQNFPGPFGPDQHGGSPFPVGRTQTGDLSGTMLDLPARARQTQGRAWERIVPGQAETRKDPRAKDRKHAKR